VLPVNIRVIAATNRSLEAEVAAGRFRADLFYRLNILAVAVPPVRERPEDVPLLLARFLEQLAAKRGGPAPALDPAWVEALKAYRWPGNVRELKGFAERIDLVAADGAPELAALQELMPGSPMPQAPAPAPAPAVSEAAAAAGGPIHIEGTLDEITEQIIAAVLQAEGGNVTRAARRLGIDRTTLWRRMRR
jgi:DNA-binding NtrC family response regulator